MTAAREIAGNLGILLLVTAVTLAVTSTASFLLWLTPFGDAEVLSAAKHMGVGFAATGPPTVLVVHMIARRERAEDALKALAKGGA